MGTVVYGLAVSLDGFVQDQHGGIDWTMPDDELHQFHNDRTRAAGMALCGRVEYTEMNGYWLTADEDPNISPVAAEFAQLWRGLTKVVFSTTLPEAPAGDRLFREVTPGTVSKLKSETTGDLIVAGAGLAASFIRQGLIDEYHLFVYPIVLGGGTPFFPTLPAPLNLRREQIHQFGSGVTLLTYRAADS